jgi:hypothetical protein
MVDDIGVEILIRQKADGHARFEPVFSPAAGKRANRSGFGWLRGALFVRVHAVPW